MASHFFLFRQTVSKQYFKQGNDCYDTTTQLQHTHYLSHPPARSHCRRLSIINSWTIDCLDLVLFPLPYVSNIMNFKLPVECGSRDITETLSNRLPDVWTECCWLSASPVSAVDTRQLRPEHLPRIPSRWLARYANFHKRTLILIHIYCTTTITRVSLKFLKSKTYDGYKI